MLRSGLLRLLVKREGVGWRRKGGRGTGGRSRVSKYLLHSYFGTIANHWVRPVVGGDDVGGAAAVVAR